MKKILIAVASVLCAFSLVAAGACAERKTEGEQTVTLTGSAIVLGEEQPDEKLGSVGDVCIAADGKIYKKEHGGWTETSFVEYSVEGDILSVDYPDGSMGTYDLRRETSGPCGHTSLGACAIVYAPKCVVPGIGVRTCNDCGESFVEIVPADAVTHEIHEGENFGRCIFCNLLEDGNAGFVFDSSNVAEALGQLEDGDKLVAGGDIVMDDGTLGIEGMDITIDIAGHKLSLENSGTTKADGISLENGANLTLTDSKGSGTLTLSNGGNGNNDIFLYNTDAETTTTLTLRNIDIECTYPDGVYSDRAPIYAYSKAGNAIVNVEEGTHIHANSPTGRGLSCIAAQGAEVNLNGGIFEIEAARYASIGGYTCAVEAGEGANVHLNDCEINIVGKGGNLCGIAAVGEDVNITMSGGTIDLRSEDVPAPELETELAGIYTDIGDYESIQIVMESGTINVATGYKNGSEGIGVAFNTFRSEGVSWTVGEEFIINVDKEAGSGNFVYYYSNRGIYDSEPNLTIPDRYNTPDLHN